MAKVYFPVVTSLLESGGVTVFLCDLVAYLKSHHPELSVSSYSGELKTDLDVSGQLSRVSKIRKKIYKVIGLLTTILHAKKYDLFFINTSMNYSSMLRDTIQASICCVSNVRYSFFIHGWNEPFFVRLQSSFLWPVVVRLLNNSCHVFVLSEVFKARLVKAGVESSLVSTSFTCVSDDFVPLELSRAQLGRRLNVLFLARLIKEKGLYESLSAFNVHIKSYPNSTMVVAGSGPELEPAKRYVKENGFENISFVGYADNTAKKRHLENSDVLIFPSYSEGMPISIFEAMSYGNAIITRPVGGIPDFFEEPHMGFLIDSLSPCDFAEKLNALAEDNALRHKISCYNHSFVRNNATAKIVFNKIIDRVLLDC